MEYSIEIKQDEFDETITTAHIYGVEDETIKLEFSPDMWQQNVPDVSTRASLNNGSLDLECSTGGLSVKWNSKTVTWEFSIYQSGQGGSFKVETPANDSFRETLKKWARLAKKRN